MSNVPSKSVQFFLVKLLLMLLVKSTVACKPVFNDPNKHQSKFICKSVSNVSNVKPNVPRKPILNVTCKLSNSFVNKSASPVSDSPDLTLINF